MFFVRKSTSQQIQIKLGIQPTIISNDTLGFLADRIQVQTSCPGQNITAVYESGLQISPTSYSPSAQIQGPTAPVTLCEEQTLRITRILYDGNRGLSNFVWSLIDTNATLPTTKILQVITTTNQNGGLSMLKIPPLTLQEYSTYTFKVAFSNFMSKTNEATFTLETTTFKGTSAKIIQTEPFVFKVWKQNEMQATVRYLDCSTGTLIYTEQALSVSWKNVANPATPVNLLAETTEL